MLATPLALVALAALLAPHAGAPAAARVPAGAPQEEPPTAVARPLAGAVHWIEGRGGNLAVSAGPDGLLVVDTQFEFMAPSIRAALAELSDQPVRFVVNTHWHGDHTGGNVALAGGAPVVAHRNVRARMGSTQTTAFGTREPAPVAALPVVTYADEVQLHFNGEEVRVFHLPSGHTDGDSVVLFPRSGVAHLGDLFFPGNFPYVDLATGGSVRGLARNAERLLEVLPDEVTLLPGHGRPSRKQDLRAYAEMLRGALAAVAAELEAGRDPAAIRESAVLAPWDGWGQGFISTERFLEFVLADLTADER